MLFDLDGVELPPELLNPLRHIRSQDYHTILTGLTELARVIKRTDDVVLSLEILLQPPVLLVQGLLHFLGPAPLQDFPHPVHAAAAAAVPGGVKEEAAGVNLQLAACAAIGELRVGWAGGASILGGGSFWVREDGGQAP